jgi:hypothetical protein
MPGGDGTGPVGAGPMTGRAAGYCVGSPVPGYANPIPGRGRGGFGYGRGWGGGRGWGRGRGWRGGWSGYGPRWGYPYGVTPYYGDPYAPELTPQQEAEMLKKEAKAMKDEIDSINQRISELESAAQKTG